MGTTQPDQEERLTKPERPAQGHRYAGQGKTHDRPEGRHDGPGRWTGLPNLFIYQARESLAWSQQGF